MCAICGYLALVPSGTADPSLVAGMMGTMHHRGPDGEGTYVASELVLGHKRLSIIDLNRGKQPLSNEDGSVWVVFNGEIYNFKELRAQLASRGHVFKTATDTEVIVHLYEDHGEDCVDKLRGMFAFAIWDEKNKKLLLARDRLGIKPLYYFLDSRRLIFASEIKALVSDRTVPREVDLDAVQRFLTFKYVPGEKTLLRNVLKLEPGRLLIAQNGETRIKQYWDLRFEDPRPGYSLTDATSELVDLLRSTVRDHMVSDVPVGVLLSGGVDSTALLSFVVEQTAKPVQTFTVGFDGGEVADERPFARLAARRFGAMHHEMTISARDFLEFLPKYVWHMEEPVCEPPAVALYYVTRLASEHVKVLLSGEGGDEAFGGYQNYRSLLWLERAKRLGRAPTRVITAALDGLRRWTGSHRAAKYRTLMTLPLQRYYYSRTFDPLSPLHAFRLAGRGAGNGDGGAALMKELFRKVNGHGTLNRMLYIDSKTWLPDDLLVKADKMTMANSVELRVPYLDHQLLEFAARLPENAKVRGITTKYILKRAFRGRIPQQILNRPKAGFPVPYETWLGGALRPALDAILRDRRTVERGYFDSAHMNRLLDSPDARRRFAPEVFSLVVLELWHRQFVDSI